MVDNPKDPSGLTPKDFVVVLPFFGSATAVCWEVGSFVPIGRGAFSMFSLSEHLLFALQALPIALASTGFGGVCALAIRTALRHRLFGFERRGEARQSHRRRRLIRTALAGIYLCSALLFAVALHQKLLSFLLASIGALALAFVASRSLHLLLTPTAAIVAACFALMGAMSMGFDQTRATLAVENRLTEMVMNDGTRKGILIRAGERGILMFDPSTRVFSFLKQDAIRSLNWDRPTFRR